MFYGIFNMPYGRTRVCVYHLQPGVWRLERWDARPSWEGGQQWQDMGLCSPRLGMRLVLRYHTQRSDTRVGPAGPGEGWAMASEVGTVATSLIGADGEKVHDYLHARHPYGGDWLVDARGEPVLSCTERDGRADYCCRCQEVGHHRVVTLACMDPGAFWPLAICDGCWPLVFPSGVRVVSEE